LAAADPLIIVDGVITRYGLADIAGEDVERVEIVRVPRLPRYTGLTRRTCGAVFTKRGQSLPEGGVRISTRFEAAANNMRAGSSSRTTTPLKSTPRRTTA